MADVIDINRNKPAKVRMMYEVASTDGGSRVSIIITRVDGQPMTFGLFKDTLVEALVAAHETLIKDPNGKS